MIDIRDEKTRNILQRYPSPLRFLQDAVRIFDRLISYHIDMSGFYDKDSQEKNWEHLIRACEQSIDLIIQETFEQGYCKIEGKKKEDL
jgi:hypothetical protein